MKLNLPPKLVEKLVCVPIISFCKIFIPSYHTFDALLHPNWVLLPLNWLTLWIILMNPIFYTNYKSHIQITQQHPSNPLVKDL